MNASSSGITTLIVPVPEAEAIVKTYRERYDPCAVEGVPAHITVLFPFKPMSELNVEVLDQLERLFSNHRRFSFILSKMKRFPNVLYLVPEPNAPFKTLTNAVADLFPETPPYEGLYPEVIPHLTVAQPSDPAQLDDITDRFWHDAQWKLPIQADANQIWLMEKRQARWHHRHTFVLMKD